MSYNLKQEAGVHGMPVESGFFGLLRPIFFLMIMTLFASGCTKDQYQMNSETDQLKAAGIDAVVPANLADSVAVNPILSVTFAPATDPSKLSAATFTLKHGSSSVPGKTTISGTTASFEPLTDLAPETEYTASVKTGQSGAKGSEGSEYSWKFKTGKHHRNNSLTVVSTDPADKATAVPVGTQITVTFAQEVPASMRNPSLFVLKKGQTVVEGSLSFSGTTAVFKPAANLTSGTVYSGKVRTGSSSQESDDDKSGDNYYWSFTTGGEGNDVTAPAVSSVLPANNAASVTAGSTYNVTFSEPINPSTVTAASVILKQGSVAVAGKVTYSGVTATFTPSAPLAANTVYTGTVTTAVKDVAGNALAAAFTSEFTTQAAAADVAAPSVVSVTPVSNATAVAVSTKPTVTFSEAMNATSITSSSFSLKQGSTDVAGTVSYSGTTATFTPSAALAGGTIYTGTVTTGAKDAAGNSLAANYTWTFTTITTPVLMSFANDVVPVLNLCNNCHTHPWTTSTNASTFYTNLVNGGYVNTSSPTTSKIYTKLSGGHPGGTTISATDINKILNWFTEGAKNN